MKSIKFGTLDKLYDTTNDKESLGHLSGPHADTAAIESSTEAMPVTNDSSCTEEVVKSKLLHEVTLLHDSCKPCVFKKIIPTMFF